MIRRSFGRRSCCSLLKPRAEGWSVTVTVKVEFTNRKYPEDDVSQSFSGYEDFDATQSLDAVEGGLCETIIEKIVEDIFNATVAQW